MDDFTDVLGVAKGGLNAIRQNPILSSVVATGAIAGVAGTAIAIHRKKKKSSTKRRYVSARKRAYGRSKRSSKRRPRYARTAGKKRDTSKRRIRMTSTGQPYVILASGKARFISKKSARLSRKRTGGRY